MFGVVMAFTFHGWGALLDDILQKRSLTRTPVARGALGLAVVLALGGILNIFHLLVGPVYALLLGIGVVYAIVCFGRQLRNRAIDWRWCAIVSIGALLLLPVYLQSLDTDKLNPNDDYYSYLVMPMRILQLGTLQPDVFNYRAAISGPGGMAFLQAPVIGLFGVNAIRLADQGCGLLLLIGATATPSPFPRQPSR